MDFLVTDVSFLLEDTIWTSVAHMSLAILLEPSFNYKLDVSEDSWHSSNKNKLWKNESTKVLILVAEPCSRSKNNSYFAHVCNLQQNQGSFRETEEQSTKWSMRAEG